MGISESEFLEKAMIFKNVLGAGAVSNINAALGGNSWQQGAQNAILVRDLREDSSDLAPYLDVDGKWHIPADKILMIDTTIGSDESTLGREIVAEGNLTIGATSPGASIGILQNDAIGNGDCMISSTAGGAGIMVENVSLVSLDFTRPIFDLAGISFLMVKNFMLTGVNLGSIDATNIKFDCFMLQSYASRIVIGASCLSFSLMPGYGMSVFMGDGTYGFDFSSIPASPRTVTMLGFVTQGMAGEGVVVIDADNGDNLCRFTACELKPGGGAWAIADSDAVFNAGPEHSPNFEFDVVGWPRTQRMGELYFSGTGTIAVAAATTWYDINPATVLGDHSNGFEESANGELEYTLPEATHVMLQVNLKAVPTSGTQKYKVGVFHCPSGGSYAQVQGGGFNIEQECDPSSGGPTMTFLFNLPLLMENGDKVKCMVQNLDGTNDFDVKYLSIIANVI